jgi:hypothetical protein
MGEGEEADMIDAKEEKIPPPPVGRLQKKKLFVFRLLLIADAFFQLAQPFPPP